MYLLNDQGKCANMGFANVSRSLILIIINIYIPVSNYSIRCALRCHCIIIRSDMKCHPHVTNYHIQSQQTCHIKADQFTRFTLLKNMSVGTLPQPSSASRYLSLMFVRILVSSLRPGMLPVLCCDLHYAILYHKLYWLYNQMPERQCQLCTGL